MAYRRMANFSTEQFFIVTGRAFPPLSERFFSD
jgi:hypothetical protein